MSLPPLDAHTLQAALGEYFAPWVQALNLEVEAFTAATPAAGGSVVLRLPQSAQLSRVGGMTCGQAMMAAADTAMVLALMAHLGAFRPMTTVQLQTSFLKPLANQDGLVTATVLRAGKTLAFGEVDIRGAVDGKSVARATTTYALL
jgi:acyl-coenzyme A thioesterase PaaI-like protein